MVFEFLLPHMTLQPPPPALAFCQVQDKTVQRFLFHIKAKMMDGALQNDAVQEAFQVLPHITWNVDID